MADDQSLNPTAARHEQQLPQLLDSLTSDNGIIAAPAAEQAAFESLSAAERSLQAPLSEHDEKPALESGEPPSSISSATLLDPRSSSRLDSSSEPTPPTTPNSTAVTLRGGALPSSDAASAPPSNSPPRGRKRVAPINLDPMVKRQKTNQGGRGRKSKDDAFNDPEAILGPEKSPLYDEALNLQAILEHPKAQAILNSTDNFLCDLSIEDLQRAIADFKEDGRASRHDAQWLTESNEASGRRMAGDFDPYLEAVFVDTWGEENEALSDSDAEPDDADEERMAIDQVPSTHKNGDDDAAAQARNISSTFQTNGHHTPTSDQSPAVNGPFSNMDAVDNLNEADNLDEMPDTDSSNGSEPGVGSLALDGTPDEASPASNPNLTESSQSGNQTAPLGDQASLPETEHPPTSASLSRNGDVEMSVDERSPNGAEQVAGTGVVGASKNPDTTNAVQQAFPNVESES